MGSIKDMFDPLDFTGKKAKKAAKKVAKGNERALETQRKSVAQAREDLFKLFPAAQQNANLGNQAALDVFGQGLNAQTDVFTQGNMGAQQQLLAGLPIAQNAILGGNIDTSSLQPFQIQQPDLGFLQQQLPEFVDPYAPTPQPQQQNDLQAVMGPNQNNSMPPNLGGFGGFGGLGRAQFNFK